MLLAVPLMLAGAPAWAVDPAVIASQGTGSIAACASCHGKDGAGMASFPRLAGLDAAYLEKQMQDFVEGSRQSPVMKPIAQALSPADRAAMAAYYAALPPPPAPAQPATADGSPGARIALHGKWSQNVPACVQCHGPGGRGVGEHFPAIAAQPAGYIAAQLAAFRDGSRTNDPLELMRHLADGLSEEETTAVAQWFSRMPALPPSGETSTGAAP